MTVHTRAEYWSQRCLICSFQAAESRGRQPLASCVGRVLTSALPVWPFCGMLLERGVCGA